jgi:hypothetical protein
MDSALVQFVWDRASFRCEYCGIPQDLDDSPFEIDHIIAIKHGGRTIASNLALSCFHDNSHKGPNVAGFDPTTRRLTRLFNPRHHKWRRHFCWQGAYLLGRTAIGRVTIVILKMNDPLRITLREGLMEEGRFPPPGHS